MSVPPPSWPAAARPPLGLPGAALYLGAVTLEAFLAGLLALPFFLGPAPRPPAGFDKDGDFISLYLLVFFLLVMATTALFLLIRPGSSPLSQLAIRKPPLKQTIFWLGAIIGLALLSDEVFRLLGIDPLPEWMESVYRTADHPLLFFLAVALIAPLTEEIVFRGVIFGAAGRRLGPVFAVIVSTLPWTLLHAGQYEKAFLVLIMALGVLLGLARHYSKSLFVPLIMHGANNLLALWQVSSSG